MNNDKEVTRCKCLQLMLDNKFIFQNLLHPEQFYIYQVGKNGKTTTACLLIKYCPECGEAV